MLERQEIRAHKQTTLRVYPRKDSLSGNPMTISFASGTVVDQRYSLIEELGAGGMGIVYKAQELELERFVAIKLLHASLIGDEENRLRFNREGRVLATLAHPNILQVYRFGTWESQWLYIAMEYLQGRSLRQILSEERPAVARSLNIGVQVCNAMQAAHNKGIVHRDISPNNIMLIDGEDDFVKIIDFGLSKFMEERATEGQHLTGTGMLIGSVYYMSPEQCSGQHADHRSDIYSLGCVLYEMVAGVPPFDAENPIGMMRMHSSENPASLTQYRAASELPIGLENAIFRAMAKHPDQRYQSMTEFGADISLVARNAGESINPPPTQKSKHGISLRGARVGVLTMILTMVAAATLIFISLYSRSNTQAALQSEAKRGESAATLRRLRDAQFMGGWSPGERIAYYQSWLATYGKNQLWPDVLEARMQLAALVDTTDSAEADRQRKSALEMCKNLIYQCITRHECREADVTALKMTTLLRMMRNRSLRIKTLQTTISILDSHEGMGFIQCLNTCRAELAQACYDQGDYEASLKLCDQMLNSADQCSMYPGDKEKYMLNRARYLWDLHRVTAAKDQLIEVGEFAFRNRPDTMERKLDIIHECLRQKQYRLCLKNCQTAEDLTLKLHKRDSLEQTASEYAAALQALGKNKEAYDLLSSRIKSLKEPQRLTFWLMMNQLNVSGNLHQTRNLVDLIESETRSVSSSDELYLLHRVIYNAVTLYVDNGCYADAAMLLDCLGLLRKTWTKDTVPLVYLSALELANQLAVVHKSTESVDLVQDLLSQVDWTDRDKLRAGIICHHLVGHLMNCRREDEALKLLNDVLSTKLVTHSDSDGIDSVVPLMVMKGRLLSSKGRHSEARRIIMEAKDLAGLNHNNDAQCDALVNLAHVEISEKNYEKAKKLLREAKVVGRKYPGGMSLAQIWLMRTYAMEHNNAMVLNCGDELVKIFDPVTSSAEYRKNLREYILQCHNIGEHNRAAILKRELDSQAIHATKIQTAK